MKRTPVLTALLICILGFNTALEAQKLEPTLPVPETEEDLSLPSLEPLTTLQTPVCMSAQPDNHVGMTLLPGTNIKAGSLNQIQDDDTCILTLETDTDTDYGVIVEYSLSNNFPILIKVKAKFNGRQHPFVVMIQSANDGPFEWIATLEPDFGGYVAGNFMIPNPSLYRQANSHLYVKYYVDLPNDYEDDASITEDDLDFEWGDIDPD